LVKNSRIFALTGKITKLFLSKEHALLIVAILSCEGALNSAIKIN